MNNNDNVEITDWSSVSMEGDSKWINYFLNEIKISQT